MKESDLKQIEQLLWRVVPVIIDTMNDEPIGAAEVARIMGYKSVSMVNKNPEFFGGTREEREDGSKSRWVFSRNTVNRIRREGRKPGKWEGIV